MTDDPLFALLCQAESAAHTVGWDIAPALFMVLYKPPGKLELSPVLIAPTAWFGPRGVVPVLHLVRRQLATSTGVPVAVTAVVFVHEVLAAYVAAPGQRTQAAMRRAIRHSDRASLRKAYLVTRDREPVVLARAQRDPDRVRIETPDPSDVLDALTKLLAALPPGN